MSKAANLAKNTAILALGKLSSQLIGFLLLPLYTYYLSPEEYGLVDLVIVYTTLLVPALTLQLEMASFRYLVDARKSETERVRVISNIVYMATFLSLPWIIGFVIFGKVINLQYVWSIAFTGFVMLYANMAMQMTRGLGNNRQYAVASILIGLTTLASTFVFIKYMGLRVEGMLLSIAIANTIASLYLTRRMKLYRYVRFGMQDSKLQRDILGYSVPLVPNGIAWWVINASDRTIISAMLNTAANGVYAVATKYSAILNSLFGIFNMSWTESASLHIDSPDRDQFFSRVANTAVRVFGTLGLGLIATIPLIFPSMIDTKFSEAYLYIPIMVIGVFFNVIVGIYSAIYVAKKLTKQVMNTSLAAAGLNIILTISLVPFFGLYAAAGATSLAFITMAIFRHYDVRKYVKITYDKSIFFILALLYVLVINLYYMNTVWASIVGFVLAATFAYSLNHKDLHKIKSMLLRKLRAI